MDFDEYEQPSWGVISPQGADLVKDTARKEEAIREIIASQEGLKAMLSKVQSVQKEVDKLASGNETLQMYIDNLTVQMAKRR